MDPRRRAHVVALTACLATFAVTGWVAAGQAGERPGIRTVDVPSNWDDVPLRCRTTKVRIGEEDIEWFRCRETGPLRPPPGRYRDTSTVWYSDIDRRPAIEHDIIISPSGELTGWARYR